MSRLEAVDGVVIVVCLPNCQPETQHQMCSMCTEMSNRLFWTSQRSICRIGDIQCLCLILRVRFVVSFQESV